MDNSTDKTFFCESEVEKSRYEPITTRFETLINCNCEAPFDWYKDLGLDKSYASKIRRGLIIPPLWLRIKIAQYFKTDSSTIWKISDLEYFNKIKKEIAINETIDSDPSIPEVKE